MRVALVGSHGCGKTTLLNTIETRLRKITEVSRKLQKELGYNPLVGDSSYEEKMNFEKLIFEEQVKQEKGGHFLSDRSVYDVLGYSSTLLDPLDYADMVKKTTEYLLLNPYTHVFYLPIEFPMEKDGVRPEAEEYRQDVSDRMQRILQQFDQKYYTLTGSIEERVTQFNSAIYGKGYKETSL